MNCDILKIDGNENIQIKKIKTLYELYQLKQLIQEAIRVTMTTSTLIDHIMTNTPENVCDSGVIRTGISDHSLVFAIKKISAAKKVENTVEIRNMKKFNCYGALLCVEYFFNQVYFQPFSFGFKSYQRNRNTNSMKPFTFYITLFTFKYIN